MEEKAEGESDGCEEEEKEGERPPELRDPKRRGKLPGRRVTESTRVKRGRWTSDSSICSLVFCEIERSRKEDELGRDDQRRKQNEDEPAEQ